MDLRNNQLIDRKTNCTFRGCVSVCDVPSVNSITLDESAYHQLLAEFPEITRRGGHVPVVKHTTRHHIETTPGPLVVSKRRHLAPDRFIAVRKEFETMVRLGPMRPSSCSWAAPFHIIPKDNREWRPYRIIERSTCTLFPIAIRYDTKLTSHRRSATRSSPKSTLSERSTKYQYQRKALKRQPPQHHLTWSPSKLLDYTTQRRHTNAWATRSSGYPFSIHPPIDEEDHLKHLPILLQRLHDYGIFTNMSKCILGVSEVLFLGHLGQR